MCTKQCLQARLCQHMLYKLDIGIQQILSPIAAALHCTVKHLLWHEYPILSPACFCLASAHVCGNLLLVWLVIIASDCKSVTCSSPVPSAHLLATCSSPGHPAYHLSTCSSSGQPAYLLSSCSSPHCQLTTWLQDPVSACELLSAYSCSVPAFGLASDRCTWLQVCWLPWLLLPICSVFILHLMSGSLFPHLSASFCVPWC